MSINSRIVFPEIVSEIPEQKKSYKLNFATGEVGSRIDGKRAFLQWVRKAIKTIRYNHVVYSDLYGNDSHELIGKDYTNSYINSELLRMTKECLIYDERINDVYDFTSNMESNGSVTIRFTLDSMYGDDEITEVLQTKGDDEFNV